MVIVDDHALFAGALAEVLSADPGLDVVGVAGTIIEARQVLAEAGPVDVVLLDYRLPDTNGVDGIQQVLAAAPSAAVVLVTAVQDEAVLADAVQAGCAGFITKTSPLGDLVDAVRSAAEGEALVSPDALAALLTRVATRPPQHGGLTPREQQLLELAALGMTNAAIAAQLGLAVNTVRNYMQRILDALGTHSKLEAVAVAVAEGLIERKADPR